MTYFIALVALVFLSASALAVDAGSLKTPNMSANALFLYRNSNFHKENADPTNLDKEPNGFNLQETELQFYSDVDPYTHFNLVLSVHPELETTGTEIMEKWVIEPEEAFAESNTISDVTLRIGKFKGFLGKHNILHTHAFPFIQAPLANQMLLGDEGLNDMGMSAAWLLPAPWFSELTFQYLRGKGENEEFKSPSPGDGVGLVHWKNLVDLSDSLTVELGASYAKGENSFRNETSITGADLTFKWRPEAGGRYHSLIWSSEFLSRARSQDAVVDEKGSGFVSWIQYQFAERWAGLYRFDNLTVKETFDLAVLPNDIWERHSVGLVYTPSEFSAFKLEYDQRHGGLVNANNETSEKAVFLQANFTIGAHPAHSY
jgi:hypothetical protein